MGARPLTAPRVAAAATVPGNVAVERVSHPPAGHPELTIDSLTNTAKQRLDTLLAERGLFSSRTRAAASVMAGEVTVGRDGRRAAKPGEMVAVDAELGVRERPPFVSRGGVKLANALDAFGLDVDGRLALDVGASTGGFTDCLLQRGAARVVAVDVGYGELDYGLRTDPRVTLLERTNARSLRRRGASLRARAGGARRVVHLARARCCRRCSGAWPTATTRLRSSSRSSRSGRERVGKGGVVRSAEDRRAALVGVGVAALAARRLGARLSLLGPARPEGQSRDVRVACRARSQRAELARGGGLQRMAREVEP